MREEVCVWYAAWRLHADRQAMACSSPVGMLVIVLDFRVWVVWVETLGMNENLELFD